MSYDIAVNHGSGLFHAGCWGWAQEEFEIMNMNAPKSDGRDVGCPYCGREVTEQDHAEQYGAFWYHANCLKDGVDVSARAVDHPAHYTAHPSGVEAITITEGFNFNIGNVIKYCWRSGLKGNEVEDLKKAAWYLNREIQRVENAPKPATDWKILAEAAEAAERHKTKYCVVCGIASTAPGESQCIGCRIDTMESLERERDTKA